MSNLVPLDNTLSEYKFETTMKRELVTQKIMEIRNEMQLNSYPVNNYPYYQGEIPLIAALSEHRNDTRYTWLVGYHYISNTIGQVTLMPPSLGGLGTKEKYEEFTRRLALVLVPESQEAKAATTPPIVSDLNPAAEPPLGLPSPMRDGWTAVFDYYWQNRNQYPSLQDLANAIGYEYGYVRNQHSLYQAEKKE